MVPLLKRTIHVASRGFFLYTLSGEHLMQRGGWIDDDSAFFSKPLTCQGPKYQRTRNSHLGLAILSDDLGFQKHRVRSLA